MAVCFQGQFYLPPQKQKPQIDFLRFLCYNIGDGLLLCIKKKHTKKQLRIRIL